MYIPPYRIHTNIHTYLRTCLLLCIHTYLNACFTRYLLEVVGLRSMYIFLCLRRPLLSQRPTTRELLSEYLQYAGHTAHTQLPSSLYLPSLVSRFLVVRSVSRTTE